MHLLLAASWLDPIVNVLSSAVMLINKPINNLGWSLVILAALIRVFFWPLNTAQFKAFLGMQKIAPQLKALQAKYKDDKQRLQQETMALYKVHRVNPFAGCWPMLVQYPVIISVYYVVMNHKTLFANQSWLWIGSAITQGTAAPAILGAPIFAASLALPDLVLILLYAFSMYLSVRYVSMPATDPQQAQTQRMMAVISPVLLGFMGWKYHWPSAMVLYWFSYNAFTMGQQFYLLRRYHQPLALIDSEHVITQESQAAVSPKDGAAKASPSGNGVAKSGPAKSARGTRSKRKNKRGA
ncbi:MAG: membrane protein insertase YidC [Candidatus Eremiobacteraeota bacterium]|nr:membrane protein insertase YidC [Candidatus Eremiobacteraeota bacterium]MBV8497880.1 membrane protein insertase YidC [Candidatus Eremiobacteraeota bacterium]